MTDLEHIQRRTLDQLRKFDRFCREHGLGYFAAGGTLLGAVRHHGFIPWDDDADLLMLRGDYEKLRQLMREVSPENCFLVSGEDEAANPHSHGRFCDAGEDIVALEMPTLELDRHPGIDIFVLDGAPVGRFARLRHRFMNYLYIRLALLFAGGASERGRLLKKTLKTVLSPFLSLAEIKRRGLRWATRYPAGSTPLLVCVGGKYGYEKELFPAEMFASSVPMEFSGMTLPAPALYELYLRGHYGADYMRVPDPPPMEESHYMVLRSDAEYDFSLVVATVDRTEELARFLSSVRETEVTAEIIIADQNPDDRLDEVLAPFREKLEIVHLAKLPRRGLSAARNEALSRLRGRFVAFPDDDCVYPPGVLGRALAEFRRRPALAGVSGVSVALENPTEKLKLRTGPLTRNGLFFRGESFVHFFRREAVEKLGGFSLRYGIGGEGFQGCEDSEYLLRALDAGMTLWRAPEIRIGHPRGGNIADALRKARMYGEARMALLRQYRFPLWVRLLHAIYPLRRIFVAPKFAWIMFCARLGALFITPPEAEPSVKA